MANGLINLQTDLKSLRYGSDKPYITKNIGDAPGSQLGLEVQHRIDDTSRIAQMLIDKPGIRYLLHEAELQQINVANKIKNRGNKTVAGAVLGQLGNTAVGTAKILGSTLAQVPVNGTGLHFLKGFRTDTYLQPTGGNTASKFAQFFGAGGVEGAQYALRGEEVPGSHESDLTGRNSNYDYNDFYNLPIPKESEGHKALAEAGKPITIPGPQYETTAQPFELGRSNQIKDADQGELLANNGNDGKQLYTPQDTYTGKVAKDVIGNALTGVPIPVSSNINDNIHPKETTAEKGKLPGSINSKDEIGSINQTNAGEYLDKSKYTTAKPYKKPIENPSENKTKKLIPETGEAGQSNGNLFETFSESNQYKDAAYSSTLVQQLPNLETYYVPNQANQNTVSGKGIQEVKKDEVGNEKFTPNRDRGTLVFGTQKIQDFRNSGAQGSTLFSSADEGYANIPTEDYTQYARETRVGLGSQGKRIARVDYNAPTDPEVQDKINALDLTKTNPDGNSAARDFAKLYFEVMNPDSRESVFIHFRAFLDSLDDSFNADWQGHKYVGRAEDFYTYGGFSRDINFSFKIAAATRSEMKPLYRKMVYLASTTAPTYGDSAFMRGTVVKLTLGSYLTQVPGVITSIKYAWQTDYPWEIAMKSPESGESDVQELPMILDCSVSFKPIHDFAPQTGLYHYFTSKNTNQPGASPFFTEAEQIS